jgi:hypothetical protein
MMTGSLGAPADPVGHFGSVAEAQQALEGHAAGSYIVQVDGNGKLVVPAAPEPVFIAPQVTPVTPSAQEDE